MDEWNLPWEGGCRCGQVRFRISAPPMITAACHCRGCQQMTASAFSLSVMVPSAGFEVTAGEPAIGALHGATRHFFCPWCMSWMFTRPDGFDQFVNVRAPLVDDSAWMEPFMESFTSEKLAWVTTPAAYSYEEFPLPKDYGDLMKAFAEKGKRPPRRGTGVSEAP